MRAAAVELAFALMLAAGAAAAKSAPELDYRAPGFWTKSYSIPETYRAFVVRVTVPPEKGEGLLRRLEDRGWKATTPNPVFGLGSDEWLVPGANAARIASDLGPAATIDSLEDKTAAGGIPEYPDLYYKRRVLSRERSRLGSKRSAVPAVDGLLEAQLATVDKLIGLHERAKASTAVILLINVRPIDAGKWIGVALDRRRMAMPAAPPAPSLWQRGVSDTDCLRPPALATATIAVTPDQFASAHAKLDAIMDGYQRLGARRPCEDGLTGYFLVPQDREPDLRAQLKNIGDLVGWDRWGDASRDEGPPAWHKTQLLRADLSAHRRELEKTPHLLSLVEAELSRLQPASDAYERTRASTAVKVRFVDAP